MHLSPWDAIGPRGDRNDQILVHLSPWDARGPRGDRMTKNWCICLHGLLEDTVVTNMAKKCYMLSPWAARGHRGDRNDQILVHLSPWDARGPRGDRMTKNWCICHHGMLEDLAVTEMTKFCRMLSPWAAKGPRDDRNDQKVVYVVTMVF